MRRPIEKTIKLVTIRRVRKAVLPLKENEEIDLFKAAECLIGTSFDVKYEPERGFHALFVKINNISFLIFRNGTVNIPGNYSLARERQVLTFFWVQHLRPFVIQKPL